VKNSTRRFRSGSANGRSSYTPQEVRQYIADFKSSGRSVAAFARQEALPYHLLRSWLKGAGQSPKPHPRSGGFQNVPLSSLLGPSWAAEVVSPTGVTVRLSAQVPPSLGLELVALSCRL